MDSVTIELLNKIGINIDETNNNGILIDRDMLLSEEKYDEIRSYILELKGYFSSNVLNCLHENAETSQRWPLLNLTRQLLHHYGYTMNPIRKSDGYTKAGVKKYKRYFHIFREN